MPFAKYPANPPATGHEPTVYARTSLYLTMLGCSVVLLVAAVLLGRRLQPRLGNWNASLLAGAAFLLAIGIVMAILPPLGHLSVNVEQYGRHATETPLPLRNPDGTIAYSGFPADLLFSFRFYSVVSQLILWTTIGLAFGPLAERVLGSYGAAGREPRASAVG